MVGNAILVNGLVVGLSGDLHGLIVAKWSCGLKCEMVRFWGLSYGVDLFNWSYWSNILLLLVHSDHQTSGNKEFL